MFQVSTANMAKSSRQSLPAKNLHVELDGDFHRKIKLLCTVLGVSLKDFATASLEEKFAREKKALKRVPRL